jgi:hypothetical protein
MKLRQRIAGVFAVLALPWLAQADGANGAGEPTLTTELAQRSLNAAHEHIIDHSFAKAAEELASSRVGDGPVVRLERGRLALFEERCDEAAKLLIAADVAPIADAKDLLEIAQGCARVTAATPQRFDAASNIAIRFQDPDDEALYPLLLETAIAAKAMLTKELGVDWPSTLRITVVRDHLSLSAMTGLPYESARTTGTVAVAKWGRVTLLSPRAPRHGYSFRDTLTHELTHLAVTRATADRAPLWLQEGLAKRQEIRWRPAGPYDARISPEAVAKRGETLGLTLPLDRLGPSIAMLPSADQAVVVFAEVTSFVKYLFASQPEGTVAKVLLALRNEPEPLAGHDADADAGAASTGAGAASTGAGASGPAASGRVEAAMKAATGVGLVEWDKRWHSWLATQNTPLSATIGLQQKPDPSLEQVGEKSRLATLLLARGHAAAAQQELAAIAGKAEDDAALRTLRARALEANGKTEEARALLADPAAVLDAHGPYFALRGRLGPADRVEPSFAAATAEDPLGVETACRSLAAEGYVAGPLCTAALARKLSEPYGD